MKILFICHGNICRSAMAKFIFREMVKRAGREGDFLIDSAACSASTAGSEIYPPAARCLKVHGVPCEGHRARQVREEDMERFDLLLIMDDLNAERLKRLYGWTPGGKLRYLMDFAAGSRPQQEVADPWYTGDFEQSFKDITAACEGLLRP